MSSFAVLLSYIETTAKATARDAPRGEGGFSPPFLLSLASLTSSPLAANRKDVDSDHLLLISPSGHDIGTVRLFPPLVKLGRLAVSSSTRGTGAGKVMMEVLEEHVKKGRGRMGEWARSEEGRRSVEGGGGVRVQANVQKHAEGFYAKCGYTGEGDDFLEVSDCSSPEVRARVKGRAHPFSLGAG